MFRHGKMIEASYSRGIFQSHMASIAAHTRSHPNSLLELGPGDSVATAIWARAQSIHRTTLVDAGRFVTSEVDNWLDWRMTKLAAHRRSTRCFDCWARHTSVPALLG